MKHISVSILTACICLLPFGCNSYHISVIDLNGKPIPDSKFLYLQDLSTKLEHEYSVDNLSKLIKAVGVTGAYAHLTFSNYSSIYRNKYNGYDICFQADSNIITYDVSSQQITGLYSGYASMKPFSEGLAAVLSLDEKAETSRRHLGGYIDSTGAIVIPFRYDSCGSFYNGMAVVGKKSPESNQILFGIINRTGEYLIPPTYQDLYYNTDGLFPAVLRESSGKIRSGLITSTGEFTLKLPANEEIRGPLVDGRLLVRYPDGYKLVSFDGRLLTDFGGTWDEVYPMFNDRSLVRRGAKYGYIDISGKVIISPKYRVATSFANGMALVSDKRINVMQKY